MAVTMVRGDEREKLKPWRFLEQISERGKSFSVCAVGFFFFFWWLGVTVVVGGWWLWSWFIGDELEKLKPWSFLEQISKGGRSFTGLRKMERQWERETERE